MIIRLIIRRTSTILLMLLIATPFSALASDTKAQITKLLLTHPYPLNQDRQKGEPTLTVYPKNFSDHALMVQDVRCSLKAIEDVFTNNQNLKDSRVGNTIFGLMIDTYISRLKNVLYTLEIQQNNLVDTPGQHKGPKRRPHHIKIDALERLKSTLEALTIVYPERETLLVDTFMMSIKSAIDTYNQNITTKDKFCDLDEATQNTILAKNHARAQNQRCQELLSLLSAHPNFALPSEEQIEAAFKDPKEYEYYQTIRPFMDQTGAKTHTLGILEQPVNALVAAKTSTLDPKTSREILAQYLSLDEKHTQSLHQALQAS